MNRTSRSRSFRVPGIAPVTPPHDTVTVHGRSGPRPHRERRTGAAIARYAALTVVFVILVGPFVWQLSLSFKGVGDNLYTRPPQILPGDPTLENYREVVRRVPIPHYVLNSATVALISVAANVAGATCAGFALARLRFWGRSAALSVFVLALLVPGEIIIVAQFLLMRSLGLNNTLLGVALPTAVAALNVLLMRNAFRSLPVALEEAAVIDGATVWKRFLLICVPQVKGAMAVVAIFAFVGSWNDFLWPLIVLSDQDKYTLTVGLNALRGTFFDNPRVVAAGTVIAVAPILLFFFGLQRFFFRGVEEGGIKG
ncbi:carbohydrate ABC transporter permease [Streptomyces acidicola]|uniref:carbohydrate ABC transporter permease n=1 Tax=Streptomyces acidicola TaxID=2596892 RepID=UPI00343CC4E5